MRLGDRLVTQSIAIPTLYSHVGVSPPHPFVQGLPGFPLGGTDGLIHIPLCYGHMNFDRFHQPGLFSHATLCSLGDMA